MGKILFITGPHGVGKTYLVNRLLTEKNIQHFDTGPIIRELFSRSNFDSIDKWIEFGETKYGEHFTNQILCEEMEKGNIGNSNDIIITGNRNIDGVFYESKYFGLDNPEIIYLDSDFHLLKSNYEIRENRQLTSQEFQELLNKEIKQGLHILKDYVLNNSDTCLYTHKNQNNDEVYSLVKQRYF